MLRAQFIEDQIIGHRFAAGGVACPFETVLVGAGACLWGQPPERGGFHLYGKSAIFMSEAYKTIVWVSSAKKDLTATPDEVQDKIGYALQLVQSGITPDNAERMRGSLRDVLAIKVDDDDSATYRTTYVTVLGDDIFVLDTFKKKSTHGIATPQKDLDRIENRLRQARELYARQQQQRRD